MRLWTLVRSSEAADAAIRCGADGLLLDPQTPSEELRALLVFARPRGIRTLLDCRETIPNEQTEARAALLSTLYNEGLDGIMAADVGTLRMAGLAAPDCALHWGAPCHMLPDLRFAKAQNCATALLSPFLPLGDAAALLKDSPLPLMMMVYGALCPAGDPSLCLLRDTQKPTRCNEACRALYGHGDKAELPLLATRDLDLTARLRELNGLSDALICPPEDTPEAAAALTRLVRQAQDGKADPSAARIARGFGRPNPSDAALTGADGLFVTDGETIIGFGGAFRKNERQKLEAQAIRKTVPVRFVVLMEAGEPLRLAADDGEGHTVCVSGSLPRPSANSAAVNEAECDTVCFACGGIYECAGSRTRINGAVEADKAELAALRDKALEQLGKDRAALPKRKPGRFQPGEVLLPREEAPVMTIRLRRLEQLSLELTDLRPACLYLPLSELSATPATARALLAEDMTVAVTLPHVVTESERETVTAQLERLRECGISEALVHSPGQMLMAARLDYAVRADWGMAGSQCLKAAKRMNLRSCTLAPWLRFSEIAEISHVVPTELIVYGRLPLLLSRRCIVRPKSGLCACENRNELCGPDGAYMPLLRDSGHGTLIYASQKLWLYDYAEQWRHIGLWAGRMDFTTENAPEAAQAARAYAGQNAYMPHSYTRGFYPEPEPPPKQPSGFVRLLSAARRRGAE